MASREQNITLIVQGMRLPCVWIVNAPDYRIAAAELNARAEAYKTQFAELASTNSQDLVSMMVALDRSITCIRTREDVDTQPLMQQVKALNLAIDGFLNQYR